METVSAEVQLVSGTSCEFLTSQIQDFSGSILCVRNGWQILIFADSSTIPQNLRLELVKPNPTIKTVEYHYRRHGDGDGSGDLYVFFVPELKEWFESGRRGLFYLMVEQGEEEEKPCGIEIVGDIEELQNSTKDQDGNEDQKPKEIEDRRDETSKAASSVPICNFSDDDEDLVHLISPSSKVDIVSSMPINRSRST